ncbi:1652_t:CDS:2, partial [Scutellospora calospora]
FSIVKMRSYTEQELKLAKEPLYMDSEVSPITYYYGYKHILRKEILSEPDKDPWRRLILVTSQEDYQQYRSTCKQKSEHGRKEHKEFLLFHVRSTLSKIHSNVILGNSAATG